MSEFETRYKKLNAAQKRAVDTIDGPLLVIAGPGTGKTELLSMRAANILKKTDTTPENILLLTFTESGANAMRERLAAIIGPSAYKVAIHTFHGFGTDIINQYREYFYGGAVYQPADEITSYELLEGIFDTLDYTNPLASKNQGEYVYINDTLTAIGELKASGLTSDELLSVIDANEMVLDSVERDLSRLFENRIATSMLSLLAPLAQKVAALAPAKLPAGITPLSNILALSMAHAFDEAVQTNKTTPITAWRNEWMEKNTDGMFVFKDRKRHAKLRALAHVYFMYISRMNEAGLYDYNDMVLNVIHAIETRADLRANLQEKFQFILVDEFQDTNLAQLRLLFAITSGEAPNVMAVGDDDQAIYSFQGADVNNIHKFRAQYNEPPIVVLTDNYRSVPHVLAHSREVIVQGSERLEDTIQELTKSLTPNNKVAGSVELHRLPDTITEKAWVAEGIAADIQAGAKPEDIAVIARRHNELVELVPYLHAQGLSVNYERRDNVLHNPALQSIITIAQVVTALHEQRLDDANALLPELAAHPAFGFNSEQLWRLSLAAYRNRQQWLEAMRANSAFTPLAEWLSALAQQVHSLPLEHMLDTITGAPDAGTVGAYTSPLYKYYFSDQQATETAEQYLSYLEALRTIRTKLREYNPDQILYLPDMLHYIALHQHTGIGITSVRKFSDTQKGAVNLLTAHKSKGLEYARVYILGAVDSAWGERVRTRSRLIGYPKNIAIAPAGESYSERLRLFYVAMTRAKQHLTISYAAADSAGKLLQPASFLTGTSLTPNQAPAPALGSAIAETILDWRGRMASAPSASMKDLLQPLLEDFKLSATALHNFTDVTRGGPQYFLLNNLLHFPSAKSPHAQYGTAIHATLQHLHNEYIATGSKRPVEDVLNEFEHTLSLQHLAPADHAQFLQKGLDSLTRFLEAKYESFSKTQKTELSFGGQGVVLGKARLTGSLDLVDIADGHITVTDYKTGTPARDWRGGTEYDKIKLHKYRQQLMFYQLLVQNSRDYAKYQFDGGVLQFVEPDRLGAIHALEAAFTSDELADFAKLITAVWHCIMNLELPDTTEYPDTLKGIQAFEHDIIDNYS